MATAWDAAKVKSQIRLTSYRLAQLQDKHDQTAHITKHDIATLIGQGGIDVARSKVERLIRDDRFSALIERLQSYCNVLLERFAELENITCADLTSDSPVIEAVCGLIVAAPRMELKDLMNLRELMVLKCGPEFTQLATQNRGNRVPSYIIDALSKRPPPSAQVDAYMVSIAKAYQLTWTPPMLPHQKAHALSEILDVSTSPRVVNLEELRRLCCNGIPQQPPWLRPRVWKLMLGFLPPHKDSWETEAHTKRQSYYELGRRLLGTIQTLPPPVIPPSPLDASLLNMQRLLSSMPHELDEELECSPLCPFDDNAPEGLRIENAGAVDRRLHLIRNHIAGADVMTGPPQIVIESPTESSPPLISVSSPPGSPSNKNSHNTADITPSTSNLTRCHTTSLLRLLYIHMSLHPSTPTTHLTSLLVPLYITMTREIESEELAHVEADSFWLFAELWSEMGELMENGDSPEWLIKFGKRLAWADPELFDDLNRKGLDPTLPHYSYRWLTPILTRTLSLQSVLTIWDALFTRPSRTRDYNFKLEFFLDICTSMLIHVRVRLFRAGNAAPKSPGLWGDIDITVAPHSSTPVEFAEGFIQGVTLLQNYPMEELGGPERVIDIALGLARRREQLPSNLTSSPSLGEKLRVSMWNGFMRRTIPADPPIAEESDKVSNGTPSPEWPDSGAEDDDATDTQEGTLLGRIGGTVWRGITNKSSMEVPPSPLMPSSPMQLPSTVVSDRMSSPDHPSSGSSSIGNMLGKSIWRGITNQRAMDDPPTPFEPTNFARPEREAISSPVSPSGLRNYTEKLKDSDAAAALSKAGSNWTAKVTALWGRSNDFSIVSTPKIQTHNARSGSLNLTRDNWSEFLPRRGSLPSGNRAEYSPPPRPNFRESRYFSPEEQSASSSPSRSIIGLPSPPNLLTKSKSALVSLTGVTQASTPKTGPRPLLLNSSSLITPSNPRSRSRSPAPGYRPSQRDSISSVSSASTSPSGMRQNIYSDKESDPGNAKRLVPLRRGAPIRPSPSPRPGATKAAVRSEDVRRSMPEKNSEPVPSTFVASPSRTPERRTSSEEGTRRGWSRVELPDSPSTLPSSPPPRTPNTSISGTSTRVNSGVTRQGGSVHGESEELVHTREAEKQVVRKKSWNNATIQPAGPLEDGNDSSTSQENRSHIKNKRYGRSTNLRLKSDSDSRRTSPSGYERKNSGETANLMPGSDSAFPTPRATDFPPPASPGRASRIRRESRSPRRPSRTYDAKESGGEEGDDEGYDEFLSTYESEDGKAAPVV